jgi:alpha-L-fucosidase
VTTQQGKRLFVHILKLEDKALYLPMEGHKVRSARLFAGKTAVPFTEVAGGILIQLDRVPDETDYVVEVVLR